MITIIKNSFKEASKKKIIWLVLAVMGLYIWGLSFIFKNIMIEFNTFGGSNILYRTLMVNMAVTTVGFYFSSMMVGLMTIIFASGVVSSEIESGIIHSIITRPIKRQSYILGKFFGLAAFLIACATILYGAIFILGYCYDIPLMTSFSPVQVITGYLYFIFIPVVLLALALFISVNFRTITSAIIIACVFFIGTVGSFIEQLGALSGHATMYNIGIVATLISPFDVIYRKMCNYLFGFLNVNTGILSLAGGRPEFNVEPSGVMMVYAFLYMFVFLLLSVKTFSKKNL